MIMAFLNRKRKVVHRPDEYVINQFEHRCFQFGTEIEDLGLKQLLIGGFPFSLEHPLKVFQRLISEVLDQQFAKSVDWLHRILQ
jgi:hypothetical protein